MFEELNRIVTIGSLTQATTIKAKKLIDLVYLGERKVAGCKRKEKLEGRIDRLVYQCGAGNRSRG